MYVKSPEPAVILQNCLDAMLFDSQQLLLSEALGIAGNVDEDQEPCFPVRLQPRQRSVSLPQVHALTNTPWRS